MDYAVPKMALAAIGSALALAACTPVERAEADVQDPALASLDQSRSCFFTREVNGFANAPDSPRGRERITVSTGVREEWLLEVRGACPDIDFSTRIAFDTRGSNSVCTGDLETLLVPSGFNEGFERCQVEVLGRVVEQDDEEG